MIKLISRRTLAQVLIQTSINFCSNTPFNQINQSKYFKPRVNVEDFLISNGIQYQTSGHTLRIKECMFCTKPHYNDKTNLFTLSLNKEMGMFYCHRCTSRGSWLDFKSTILGVKEDSFNILRNQVGSRTDNVQQIMSEPQYFIYTQNLQRESFKSVLQYIEKRGFSKKTIQAYRLGAGIESFTNEIGELVDVQVIYFPMFRFLSTRQKKMKQQLKTKRIADAMLRNTSQELKQQQNQRQNQQKLGMNENTMLVRLKVRGSGSENKKFMRQTPTSNQRGFFGLNLIKPEDKQVIITEGQFDAMSIYEATGRVAISLPQGASHLPDQILPYLDQFEKIILWMDNDQAGRINEDKIVHKLGISRTYVVRNLHQKLKDANDVLLYDKKEITELLNSAKTIPDENILTFHTLRQRIKGKIQNYMVNLGFQVNWFKFFNKKVKGFRMSELSVLSGATGSGKTTLLSQMSLDICKQGVPILWGSFQVRNQVLATNMLIQYSNVNLIKQKNKFDYYADNFENLPIYYLSFHGSSDIEKVLSTIEYAIQKYNISLVVIDTLQFFLSTQAQGFKKFDLQDKVMARIRKMVTSYNIHMVVVIHPRKTDDNEDIGIHSIYGTSKATQQADNIWIIQNRQGFKIFDVKKNRFDGQVGKVALAYNRNKRNFFELKKQQLQGLFEKKINVEQIIEKRQMSNDYHIDSQQPEHQFFESKKNYNKKS